MTTDRPESLPVSASGPWLARKIENKKAQV